MRGFYAFLGCCVALLLVSLPFPALSQAPDVPSLYLRDVVSTQYDERDMAISPDGMEMFYTLQGNKFSFSVILRCTKRPDGTWTKPEVAPFSGKYQDLEPVFTADGKKLFFSSKRPITGTDPKDADIWMVEKVNGKWSEPVNLGGPVNTEADEYYPSVASNGNLYLTAEYKNGVGKEDIFVCRWENGKYLAAVPLDTAVNSKFWEFNAYVSPDEQYILFTSYGRKDTGGGDLYISTKNKNGKWEPAKNIALINTAALDYCPFLSFDKKVLYYTSGAHQTPKYFEMPLTYDRVVKMLNDPMNGRENVYWVSFAKVLESLK